MPKQEWEKEFEQLHYQQLAICEGFDRWSPETAEELNDFLRALRRKKGFGLFFVQCNPAQATQIIKTIRERFPQKRLEQFELNRQSETLYGELLERYQAEKFEIACVTGVEQALYSYEDTKRLAGWSSEEIYNYSWKGVPPLLSHLNRQRETFEANLPIALIFLVRSFTINYFVQRAPDFFDWRSGFFKFSESSDNEQKFYQEFVGQAYKEYDTLTFEQRMENILEIKEKILHLDPSECEQKSILLLEHGRLFESNQDLNQALDCYNRALNANPQNYQVYKSKGILLVKLGRYEEAIKSYDSAVKADPNYYKAWTRRGSVLEKLERYKEAINSYDRALEIKQDFCYAWSGRGNALSKLKRYEEAIKSYDRALEIKREFYYAWYGRGNALSNLKRYEEAIESYDSAIEIKPDYYYAWSARSNALNKLQRYEEAIESYSCGKKFYKGNIFRVCLKDGLVQFSTTDSVDILNYPGPPYVLPPHDLQLCQEAIKSHDRTLKIKPDDYNAWHNKGLILYYLGRHEESSNCFAKISKENNPPFGFAGWNNQGYLALTQYSYGLQPVINKPLLIRQFQDCSGSLSINEVNLERCQKALELFNTALRIDSKSTLAWANRSFPAYYLEQYQTALESCNKSLEMDPDNQEGMNAIIYTNRGNIFLKLHKHIAALEDFKTALKIDPKLSEAWIGRGTAQYHLGYLQFNNMPIIWRFVREMNCLASLLFIRKYRSYYRKAIYSFTEAIKLNHPLAEINLNITQQKL